MSLCNNRIYRVNFCQGKVLEVRLDDFMNASRQGFRSAKPRPFLIPRLECKPPMSVIPQWKRSKLVHGCSWMYVKNDGFKCFNKWMNLLLDFGKPINFQSNISWIFMKLTWFAPKLEGLGFRSDQVSTASRSDHNVLEAQSTSHMVDIQFVSRSYISYSVRIYIYIYNDGYIYNYREPQVIQTWSKLQWKILAPDRKWQ